MFLSFKFATNENVVGNHFQEIQMKDYVFYREKKTQMCSSNYQVFLGNATAVFMYTSKQCLLFAYHKQEARKQRVCVCDVCVG